MRQVGRDLQVNFRIYFFSNLLTLQFPDGFFQEFHVKVVSNSTNRT